MAQAASASESASPKRRWLTLARREELWFWVFLAPWVLGFAAFMLIPIGASGYLSLTDYDFANPPVYVGFKNYVTLAQDNIFWKSILVTAHYTALSVPLSTAFSLLIAVILNQKIPFVGVLRTLYYLPYLLGMSVPVALLFRWILNPQFGTVNNMIRTVIGPEGWIPLGVVGPNWLLDPNWMVPSLVMLSVWSSTGSLLVYLAALQGVPTALYEAATIDGANARQQFFKITLPMISPAILFTVVNNVIVSFQIFTQAYVLSNKTGGPAFSATTYIFYLFTNAFRRFNLGLASAQALIFMVVLVALTALLMRISTRFVYYESGQDGDI